MVLVDMLGPSFMEYLFFASFDMNFKLPYYVMFVFQSFCDDYDTGRCNLVFFFFQSYQLFYLSLI